MRLRRVAVVFIAVGVGPIAAAQDSGACPEDLFRGPRFVMPADGATQVTIDAPVRIDFTPVDYFEDPAIDAGDPAEHITILAAGSDAPVPGTASVVDGGFLFFLPDEPWIPSTSYDGVATGLDGELPFRFTTGSEPDLGPPLLGAIEEVRSQGTAPSCDAPAGGYRLDVSFQPATDDGPAASLEYFLFLSRGHDVDEPHFLSRTRNFSTQLVTMSFVLSPEEAELPVCVTVQAVDGVGSIDGNGEGACFDPVQGDFFAGICAVGAVNEHQWTHLVWLVGLLFARRRSA